MDSAPVPIPAEVLIMIFKNLSSGEIKNIRLVCTKFNHLSSPFLLQSIYLSSQLHDRENLTQISDHPFFRTTVQEIIFDSTLYCEDLLHPVEYHNLIGLSSQTYPTTGLQRTAAVTRGYKEYRSRNLAQNSCAQYDGLYLTRLGDDSHPPDSLEEMIFDPQSLDQAARLLPDDLIRLIRALPRLPNVTRFILSDQRWVTNKYRCRGISRMSDTYGPQEHTFAVHHMGIPDCEKVIVDPRPWPRTIFGHTNKHWWRGFRVLTQALAMAERHNVSELSVRSGDEYDGLNWEVLANQLKEPNLLPGAFKHLKSIDLKIATPLYAGEEWEWYGAIADGSLARALASAQHLEDLSIHFDSAMGDCREEDITLMSLADMFGRHPWQHLRRVSFAEIIVSQQELLDWLFQYHQTLRQVTLSSVLFYIPHGWDYIKGHKLHEWADCLRSMATCMLELQSITVIPSWAKTKDELYHACNRDAALRLLCSGGADIPAASCEHYPQLHGTID
ncbi:MAG: hypothetical protein Q9184_004846 [Pyrenodesmia sp. 2 TL-2023]